MSDVDAVALNEQGLDARDDAHADAMITAWLETAPTADPTAWHEAPNLSVE